jgi:hypothetical protein
VKIRPVGSRVLPCRQTDRRTNLTKLIATCRSFSKRLIRDTLQKGLQVFMRAYRYTVAGANNVSNEPRREESYTRLISSKVSVRFTTSEIIKEKLCVHSRTCVWKCSRCLRTYYYTSCHARHTRKSGCCLDCVDNTNRCVFINIWCIKIRLWSVH